jgi:glycosyltransferase involved in cell wall biosynthesis
MRQRLGLPTAAPVIGCVARLMRWKGQAILVDAFAQVRRSLPDARLVLVGAPSDRAPDGRGDYADFLARRAAELGVADAVVFAGVIPTAQMPHVYGAIDVLAHPSFEEPFGLAVVEAMACGRPVIATGAGGIPEIIRDGVHGQLVPAQQPASLARALLHLLQQPMLSDQLGRAGRARVLDAFSPARQAEVMLGVYQQVVSRRERSASRSAATAQVGTYA